MEHDFSSHSGYDENKSNPQRTIGKTMSHRRETNQKENPNGDEEPNKSSNKEKSIENRNQARNIPEQSQLYEPSKQKQIQETTLTYKEGFGLESKLQNQQGMQHPKITNQSLLSPSNIDKSKNRNPVLTQKEFLTAYTTDTTFPISSSSAYTNSTGRIDKHSSKDLSRKSSHSKKGNKRLKGKEKKPNQILDKSIIPTEIDSFAEESGYQGDSDLDELKRIRSKSSGSSSKDSSNDENSIFFQSYSDRQTLSEIEDPTDIEEEESDEEIYASPTYNPKKRKGKRNKTILPEKFHNSPKSNKPTYRNDFGESSGPLSSLKEGVGNITLEDLSDTEASANIPNTKENYSLLDNNEGRRIYKTQAQNPEQSSLSRQNEPNSYNSTAYGRNPLINSTTPFPGSLTQPNLQESYNFKNRAVSQVNNIEQYQQQQPHREGRFLPLLSQTPTKDSYHTSKPTNIEMDYRPGAYIHNAGLSHYPEKSSVTPNIWGYEGHDLPRDKRKDDYRLNPQPIFQQNPSQMYHSSSSSAASTISMQMNTPQGSRDSTDYTSGEETGIGIKTPNTHFTEETSWASLSPNKISEQYNPWSFINNPTPMSRIPESHFSQRRSKDKIWTTPGERHIYRGPVIVTSEAIEGDFTEKTQEISVAMIDITTYIPSMEELNRVMLSFEDYLQNIKRKNSHMLETINKENTHEELIPLFENKTFRVAWICSQSGFNRREKETFLEWKKEKKTPILRKSIISSITGEDDSTNSLDELASSSKGKGESSNASSTIIKAFQQRALSVLYPREKITQSNVRSWNRDNYTKYGDLLNAVVKVLRVYEDVVIDDEDDDDDDRINTNKEEVLKRKEYKRILARLRTTNPYQYYCCNSEGYRLRKSQFQDILDYYKGQMRVTCAQQKMTICKRHNDEVKNNLELSKRIFGGI